mmetsp:Transcript_14011/g.18265  ORF Transcript_14011/g.18265 Transcript_14011/m.18265 type:complete len:160 (-) Transcript_14011:33-512(-)
MDAGAERIRQEAQRDRDNRDNLLGPEIARRKRKKKGSSSSTSNSTVAEATEIQKSLSRTQALLGNELKRVSHVASSIDDDGKMLEETMNEHQIMNVSKAKKALTNLQLAQQREQRYLTASIVFFWLVIAYIFWARVVLNLPLIDTTIYSIRKLFQKLLL